jgi:dsRNA-specific ribonuclease
VLALKLKFPNLRSGDAVRIRSAIVDETSTNKKVLNLSHYSNIMNFPSLLKLGKEIKSKVGDEKHPDKGALKDKLNMNAVVLTEVDKKHANLPHTSLAELFHHSDTDPELSNKNTFRTTFTISKIEPSDVKEWVKSYDKKTKKATSLKGAKAAGSNIF